MVKLPISALLATAVFMPLIAFGNDEMIENEDVIRLLQVGIEEHLVLTIIEGRQSNFDLSGRGVDQMIDAGASGAVIAAMIQARQRRIETEIEENEEEPDEVSLEALRDQIAEPLTNNQILELVNAGFEETVIIELINEVETDFDTSVRGLTELAEAGVSMDILTEMLLADELEGPEPRVPEQPEERPTDDDTRPDEITEEPRRDGLPGLPAGGWGVWGTDIGESDLVYQFVEGGLAFFPGYGWWDEIEEDLVGVHIRGVTPLTDVLFLRGGLRYLTDDLDFTWLDIGFGYRAAYSRHTEFYFGGGIDYIDVSGKKEVMGVQFDFSGDDIGVRFFSGGRYRIDERWELGTELSWGTVKPPHAASFYRITGNAVYSMTEQVGILGEIAIENGSPGILGGARWAF